MKNSLDKKGLSLSQAQSISNLCNQRSTDISSKLSVLNNAEKTLVIGEQTYTETKGNPIPSNVVELLLEKANLHATQAFLMENIKAKDNLIKSISSEQFVYDVDSPTRKPYVTANITPMVDENWAKSQLSLNEVNELLYMEAHAAHIGQFIHKNSVLESLRKELPTMRTLEWITVKDGEKTPLMVSVHHTQEQLLELHEELAGKHRGFEQRVNYFKAKIKNLTTLENARIAKINAEEVERVNSLNKEIDSEYTNIYNEWSRSYTKALHQFEEDRQNRIKEVASLRIVVGDLFKPVVDMFLDKLGNE